MAVLLLIPVMAMMWKLYQLSRAPKDAALRSVTLSLVCACASYPLAMPGGTLGVDTVAGDGAAKIGQNVLLGAPRVSDAVLAAVARAGAGDLDQACLAELVMVS
ncbi:hypothetical protein CP981_16535 [Streptomyces platensis]|uniref:Uncharacterized protein n=1 Tax=Streptomyces platensis TaxID=58346 RepID=A0AAE6TMP8_STRPT|nr:hypothetical protein [Streptomyces platensis]OSY44463.1 hypothetical protein BG653_04065 [Streptomyces platensis]QEV53059.1 hypothetical protein CP981_16535 [Streptomyces platensis]